MVNNKNYHRFYFRKRTDYSIERSKCGIPEKFIAFSLIARIFNGFSRFLKSNGFEDNGFKGAFDHGHLVLDKNFVAGGNHIIQVL